MSKAAIEHVNFTVTDPDATAAMLCEVFGWRVRWAGPSKSGGRTVHVGTEDQYIAVYTNADVGAPYRDVPDRPGALNHVALQVDDLDAIEARVKAAGFITHNHGSYEPGRRFYFNDRDNIEYEVVSYA